MSKKWEEILGIDLRSLALFRIALALLLLVYLSVLATDLTLFYTDQGVLPRSLLFETYPYPRIDLHSINGSTSFVAFLFLIQMTLAVFLLVGWKTGIVTALSWLLLTSLHARNPMLLHSGDYLLRILFFWSLFLPLGARFSLDRLLHPSSEKLPARFFSAGSAALLIQVFLVYAFAAHAKWINADWFAGRGVILSIGTTRYASRLGLELLKAPEFLLKGFSHLALGFETVGPLLLFSPFLTAPLRLIGIAGFFLLQAGFGLSLTLGCFPWISSIAVLPFVPGLFWERIGQSRRVQNLLQMKERLGAALRGRLSHLKPGPLRLGSSKLGNAAAFFSLIYIIWWNLTSTFPVRVAMPPGLSIPGRVFFLDQRWNMFSPLDHDNAWFVIVGQRKDGRWVDLHQKRLKKYRWKQPRRIAAFFKNMPRNKYLYHLGSPAYVKHRAVYSQILCRQWNRRHSGVKRLRRVQIYWMHQQFYPVRGKPSKSLLSNHYCRGKPPSPGPPAP